MQRVSKCATTRRASRSGFGSRRRARSDIRPHPDNHHRRRIGHRSWPKIIAPLIDSDWIKRSLIGGPQVGSHASRARAGRSRERQSKWGGSTRWCTKTALVTAPFLLAFAFVGVRSASETRPPEFQGRDSLALASKKLFKPAESLVQRHDKDGSLHWPFDLITELRAIGMGILAGAICKGGPGRVEAVERLSSKAVCVRWLFFSASDAAIMSRR